MPRRRRYFESEQLYEVTIRTRSGLPFPCKRLIMRLIKSALGRTQRDSKVYITHFLWMGNHAHFLVVCRDAKQLTEFYGELQKRLTDYMKRLLKLDYLDLWEGAPAVIRIADLEAAKERIAYFYANPARANLVDTVSQYLGYSSYQAFLSASPRLTARSSEKAPWVRCPAVPQVPRSDITPAQDEKIASELLKRSTVRHRITIFSNIWMACFGVEGADEIQEVNSDICSKLRDLEQSARELRISQNIRPLGPGILSRQELMREHTPKKRSRRIFVIARDKQVRMGYIALVKSICSLCEECYQRWKRLDFSFTWPPGTFPPPVPMMANAFAA